MKIQFLGQGYESESKDAVGKWLKTLLSDKRFHSFTALTAFTSVGGIEGIFEEIELGKKHLANIFIVTGIDQKVTPKEALLTLLELEIDAYIFYQVESPIFHPKIYLFEGDNKSVLIIGSSNFTSKGLFQNVESSIIVEIENEIETERVIIEDLKSYYKGIFEKTDPNLKKLSNHLVEKLAKDKIILTEKKRKKIQDAKQKAERKAIKKAALEIFPRRKVAKIPAVFRKRTNQKKVIKKSKKKSELIILNKPSNLLWESRALTQRDLNIPKNPNTNPTGSMLFKKGKSKNIDQRSYFRNVVFSSLHWTYDDNPRKRHIERAKAKFKIRIGAKDEGDFELTLNHDTRTNTTTYKQKNSMTSISWGKAKSIIAKDELIGKSAKLFKNKGKSAEFILVIE